MNRWWGDERDGEREVTIGKQFTLKTALTSKPAARTHAPLFFCMKLKLLLTIQLGISEAQAERNSRRNGIKLI